MIIDQKRVAEMRDIHYDNFEELLDQFENL